MMAFSCIAASMMAIFVTSANDFPAQWKYMGVATSSEHSELHSIRIALRQRNVERLKRHVLDMERPLTVKEVTNMIAPHEEDVDTVKRWWYSHAMTTLPSRKYCRNITVTMLPGTHDYMQVKGTRNCFAAMFETSFVKFQHTKRRTVVYRLDGAVEAHNNLPGIFERAVPNEVLSLVDLVIGLEDLPPPARPMYSKRKSDGFPGEDITPPVIWSLYKSPTPSISRSYSSANVSQAVGEFEEAYFYLSDTLSFQRQYHLPTEVPNIHGPNHPNTGDLGEASLDVEYITGVGFGVNTAVWSIPADQGFDLLAWAQGVIASSPVDYVHSLSWGSAESSYNSSWMQRVDTEFAKLASMGITVLAASGDDGPNNGGVFRCEKFTPTFPSSSPHVTAVGGTYLQSSKETCWQSSGGGVSSVFARPAWQDKQVSNYLSTASGLPSSSVYTSNGRATPDISAVSTNFQILVSNYTGPLSGTSASTPTVAGLISLINQARLAKQMPTIGLLAPHLYALGNVGTDITAGKSKSDGLCSEGWPATEGYDMCSGLGTPIYPTLLSYFLQNPSEHSVKNNAPEPTQLITWLYANNLEAGAQFLGEVVGWTEVENLKQKSKCRIFNTGGSGFCAVCDTRKAPSCENGGPEGPDAIPVTVTLVVKNRGLVDETYKKLLKHNTTGILVYPPDASATYAVYGFNFYDINQKDGLGCYRFEVQSFDDPAWPQPRRTA
eukprot:m.2956 g.2956  ORF g.2956 m.2956 type:complete len:719 (+) comp2634_c0_seq1:39-2195(+)